MGDHNENIVLPLTRHQARDWYHRALWSMGDNGSPEDARLLLVEIADDVAVAIGEPPVPDL